MYTKITCPQCEKNLYVDIGVDVHRTKNGEVLGKVYPVDTITEDDLIKIVSNFISKNIKHGMNNEEIQDILNKCIGVSPQFTEKLITKIKIPCKRISKCP